MKTHTDITLYPNAPDSTHCVQACYKMILKHFLPEQDYTWEQLDEMTAKQDGKWTWPMAGLCWFSENGFDVEYIEKFDYQAFYDRQEEYLVEHFGEEVAKAQIENSDIPLERKWTKKFIETINSENRIPTYEDMKNLLDQGYLLAVMVDYRALHNLEGYAGHCVVINGYTDTHLYMNDPDSPTGKEMLITYEQFEKGWTVSGENAKNIAAIRLQPI